MTKEITPGERRELRSVVRGQYKVLRAEVKRREQEMKSEVETELLNHYRAEDQAISATQEQVNEIVREASRQIEALGRELKMQFPDLSVRAGMRGGYGQLVPRIRLQEIEAATMSDPDAY